jgi:folate-binding Fe-S cluster repair protein YgfZ
VNRTISYKKGCYTGQEVLMRIYSRGHTNQTWMGLKSETLLSPGSKLRFGDPSDAGSVTRSANSPRFGFIAAAMIRNEAAVAGAIVEVIEGDSIVQAEVVRLPFLRMD